LDVLKEKLKLTTPNTKEWLTLDRQIEKARLKLQEMGGTLGASQKWINE
jgi:hypothetical protein